MLILDIDDFKKINDTYGHRRGDEALALVAELIKRNLRKIDQPFRYGGEEFVILLPGTAAAEAVHTAERLRAVISEADGLTDDGGETIEVRVSIGAAVFPNHARSEGELFAKADSALYRAKRKGKDRVELYDGS
jgi:diguanylate cyclase (GGDEF)-like protein